MRGGNVMKIPKPVSKRLSMYYRCLEKLKDEGIDVVSSKELAEKLDIKPSQVRKDLSYFGEFGKRGVGYHVDFLIENLEKILGIKEEWNIAIIGAGNIGKALSNYVGMREKGFKIVAVFDKDDGKVGKEIAEGIKVLHIKDLDRVVKEKNVKIGIIAVPASAAQEVAEALEKAGVSGILNFAPIKIKASIPVEEVDISSSLRTLTFEIIRKHSTKGKK